MRKLFLILVLLWGFSFSHGQSFCSTPTTSSNANLNSSSHMKSTNNSSYCLKVYFHVIRRSNGTGGQSTASVNQALNILNQDFNPHNISFSWNNQIDYIDNDSYYNNPSSTIFNINNHQDGIDIYLFDDSSSSGGRANGVGQSSKFYVSGSFWKSPFNSLIKSHVISHEMGHVLFLYHTHHGTYNEGGNDNPCSELVNGSNSASCGDYVTDTPADPHLLFDVNQTTCQWNSSGMDINGDLYDPDEKNIMAYTDVGCMEYFTQKQGERMRNAISSLNYLQQTIVNYQDLSVSTTKNGNYLTITITNGSGITPYTIYIHGINLTITTNSRNYTLYYPYQGGSITVTNPAACGGTDSASHTFYHGNYSYYTYPNPATNKLIIQSAVSTKSKEETYKIFNHKSEIVKIGKINEFTSIDVSSLNRGIYILKIFNKRKVVKTSKIILQ